MKRLIIISLIFSITLLSRSEGTMTLLRIDADTAETVTGIQSGQVASAVSHIADGSLHLSSGQITKISEAITFESDPVASQALLDFAATNIVARFQDSDWTNIIWTLSAAKELRAVFTGGGVYATHDGVFFAPVPYEDPEERFDLEYNEIGQVSVNISMYGTQYSSDPDFPKSIVVPEDRPYGLGGTWIFDTQAVAVATYDLAMFTTPTQSVLIADTVSRKNATDSTASEAVLRAAGDTQGSNYVDVSVAPFATHTNRTDNPHGVTASQIGAATAAQGARADSALQPVYGVTLSSNRVGVGVSTYYGYLSPEEVSIRNASGYGVAMTPDGLLRSLPQSPFWLGYAFPAQSGTLAVTADATNAATAVVSATGWGPRLAALEAAAGGLTNGQIDVRFGNFHATTNAAGAVYTRITEGTGAVWGAPFQVDGTIYLSVWGSGIRFAEGARANAEGWYLGQVDGGFKIWADAEKFALKIRADDGSGDVSIPLGDLDVSGDIIGSNAVQALRLRLWDYGSSTYKTGTLTNGVMYWQ